MRPAAILLSTALCVLAAAPARAQTHSVALTWMASASAAANPSLTYNVYRSPGCSGSFTRLNSSAVAATSFTDAGVAPGTYCYQVTAVLNGTESVPSSQAAAVVPAPAPPRQPPGCAHRGSLVDWIRCVASQPHAPPKEPAP
jgi:hypothetical protein